MTWHNEGPKKDYMLEILNVGRIVALVMGVLSIIIAAWSAWPVIYGYLINVIGVIYWIIAALINFIAYYKIEAFINMLTAEDYENLHETLLAWVVLTLIFGVMVGIFLLLVFIELSKSSWSYRNSQYSPPPPPPQ